MNEINLALQYFSKGYNCSQSILMAFSPRFKMPQEMACKISSPFGAGIGRSGNICGVVSGSIMTLGLAYGFTDPENQTEKDQTYQNVLIFFEKFKSNHHSIYCRDLLGLNISNPEQLMAAREQKLFDTLCPNFVHDAAVILKAMLDSPIQINGNE